MKTDKPLGWSGVLGRGFVVWLAPFALGMLIFPLQSANRQIFEGAMVLCLVAVTLLLGGRLAISQRPALFRGLSLGVVWMMVCWGIDLPLFLAGPPQMELGAYVQNIGINYLLVPMLTLSLELCARSSAEVSRLET